MKKQLSTFICILIISLSSVVSAQPSPTIAWQRCFGGTSFETPANVFPLSDGGCIIAGTAHSKDGDIRNPNNHTTYGSGWIALFDRFYDTVWTQCIGENGYTGISSIIQTKDGGFIIAGATNTNVGETSINHGGIDAWVAKLNANGGIVWQRTYGGFSEDRAISIAENIYPDGAAPGDNPARYAACSVVGSIILRTSVILVAGKPLISACLRMMASSFAR